MNKYSFPVIVARLFRPAFPLVLPLSLVWLASPAAMALPELVTNGGFETGDFTGWTLTGDTSNQGVDTASAFSGTYGAFFGTSASTFTHDISQNVTAKVGNLYDLRLRVGADAEESGGTIQVSWNGETLDLINGGGGFLYSYPGLTATSASTAVQFSFSVAGGKLRLDDVSVDLHRSALPPDFNVDGKTDFALFNASTRRTAIWYLNNNALLSSAYGPTLPAGWNVVGVANFAYLSFGDDSKPDYVLFNGSTRQTAIWFLNNNVLSDSVSGPAIPNGWQLVAVGEFNGDGNPDFVIYNPGTRRTGLWFLDGDAFVSSAFGPTLPAGWSLVALGDFNGDGRADYVLFNANTRQTAIWYLTGATLKNAVYGPTIASGYVLTGVGDFNRDGKPDFLLSNANTRRTVIWYLNNNAFVSGVFGPTLPAGWTLAAP